MVWFFGQGGAVGAGAYAVQAKVVYADRFAASVENGCVIVGPTVPRTRIS
jgi:hypothetical protein